MPTLENPGVPETWSWILTWIVSVPPRPMSTPENWLPVPGANTSSSTTAWSYGTAATLCWRYSCAGAVVWVPWLETMAHEPDTTVQGPPMGPSGRLKSSDHWAEAMPPMATQAAMETTALMALPFAPELGDG